MNEPIARCFLRDLLGWRWRWRRRGQSIDLGVWGRSSSATFVGCVGERNEPPAPPLPACLASPSFLRRPAAAVVNRVPSKHATAQAPRATTERHVRCYGSHRASTAFSFGPGAVTSTRRLHDTIIPRPSSSSCKTTTHHLRPCACASAPPRSPPRPARASLHPTHHRLSSRPLLRIPTGSLTAFSPSSLLSIDRSPFFAAGASLRTLRNPKGTWGRATAQQPAR